MRPVRLNAAALGLWLALIVASWLVGTLLNHAGHDLMLKAPPLYARWDIRLNWHVGLAAVVAAVVIASAPAATRARWPLLLAWVAVAALAFWLALALIDGTKEIELPLRNVKTQYLKALPLISSTGDFLSHFVDRIDLYPAHVRAHPPALVVGLIGLDHLGLGGTWPFAWVILIAAASAGPAALISLRRIAGEDAARRAAPYLTLSAAALSIATTADALYMAIAAWGIAALVVARSAVMALLGGVLLGLALFCSYGLALVLLVPAAVLASRRDLRTALMAAVGMAAVVAAFAAAGFWWLDGLHATRREYAQSVASTRPYWYFVFANLGAFGLWLGPAVVLGLVNLRDRRIWLLAGGALAGIAIADLTGLSKAETERIWLPFLPWIVLATAALPARALRPLLAVQAGLALVVAVTVNSLW